MKKLRYCLIEALRLYPEPPVLIRRARTDDALPAGSSKLQGGIKVLRGTDIFISTWNLHRSPDLWEDPERYDPTRWERPFRNPGVRGWEGYDPDRVSGLYPSEQAADFAFLPFGGGQRKCVGDQFAMLEAAAALSMVLKNYDFDFAIDPEDVGMKTGATIHTMNGLMMRPRRVESVGGGAGGGANSPLPPSDGWWEMRHLKRGLSATGRPFSRGGDAPASSPSEAKRQDEKGGPSSSSSSSSGCPMHPPSG
jgi:hypothetical protein